MDEVNEDDSAWPVVVVYVVVVVPLSFVQVLIRGCADCDRGCDDDGRCDCCCCNGGDEKLRCCERKLSPLRELSIEKLALFLDWIRGLLSFEEGCGGNQDIFICVSVVKIVLQLDEDCCFYYWF